MQNKKKKKKGKRKDRNPAKQHFESICFQLFKTGKDDDTVTVLDPLEQFEGESVKPEDVARQLNAAFLIQLAGRKHPAFDKASERLHQFTGSAQWSPVAKFYLNAKDHAYREIASVFRQDQDFANRLKNLSYFCEDTATIQNLSEVAENIWSLFFPEGVGLSAAPGDAIHNLRNKRTVRILYPAPEPIVNPAREILFTSNVLLTLPSRPKSYDSQTCRDAFQQQLLKVAEEPQRYWYDHPIHIGVQPQNNELLYGLRGLEETLEFERKHGSIPSDSSLTCILSVSVTHQGLHQIARPYLEEELTRAGFLKNINAYMFTEEDTQRIINNVLIPAAESFLGDPVSAKKLNMFGVDGEYGRHYSFLKAIAAFWQVFIQSRAKAVFKIDLDQVFPQQILVEQTGASAFEHFMTPLWGAQGKDADGRPVELGMIAGALVNKSDIGKSLFTSDVSAPQRSLSPDERIFFSTLPQAVSTEAEMMTRYNTERFDGIRTCIQRVHVTGGTNGIRIDSLRRQRPFTPSFIGRAEDQAYLLSAINRSGRSLAYLHKDGLIMRHDKEAFAREAIASAEIGRTMGDYIRILYFSAYAGVLSADIAKLKDTLDPFTGCFISKIPATVAYLRFSLKAASLFRENQTEKGLELVKTGAQRLSRAIEFIRGSNSNLKKQYEKERRGWNLYYDTLDAVDQALEKKDPFALALRKKAQAIIRECAVGRKLSA